jgi:hypothetical protein
MLEDWLNLSELLIHRQNAYDHGWNRHGHDADVCRYMYLSRKLSRVFRMGNMSIVLILDFLVRRQEKQTKSSNFLPWL